MPHLNLCQFIGHTARDAEIKTSKDKSKSWAHFTLAVSVGTVETPRTLWVKCNVWGKSVDKVIEKVKKGDAIFVSGRLDAGAYLRAQDNVPMPDISLTVNEWQWLKAAGPKAPVEVPIYNSTVPGPTDDLPF